MSNLVHRWTVIQYGDVRGRDLRLRHVRDEIRGDSAAMSDDEPTDEYDLSQYGIDQDYVDVHNDGAESTIRPSTGSGQIEPTWIYRGTGSGAGDWEEDKQDEQTLESNDGRSRTRTTFYSDDGGVSAIDWERLAQLNDGVQSSDRSSRNHAADRRKTVGLIVDRLNGTEYHRERSEHLLDSLGRLNHFWPGASIESIALAVVAEAIDEEVDEFDNLAQNRDGYDKIIDSIGTDRALIRKLRRKVRVPD